MSRELSAGSSEGKTGEQAMEVTMDEAWAGVEDAGKEFHWAHVLDASGRELLSRKVENEEADILRLIETTLSLWPRRFSGR